MSEQNRKTDGGISYTEQALFAGGCFWGVEDLMPKAHGVISAISGYTGGVMAHPTYQDVCTDTTGHAEAVLITFDPTETDYRTLVRAFFEIHDGTQKNRQGPDVGTQYRSAIFYFNEAQKNIAQEAIDFLRARGEDIVTELKPAEIFYPAEDYHQEYFKKHPEKHCETCHFHMPIDWS